MGCESIKSLNLQLTFEHKIHAFVVESVEMSSVPYQPLTRSRWEIRLVILKDVDGGLNTADSSVKCEMITTSRNDLAYRVKKTSQRFDTLLSPWPIVLKGFLRRIIRMGRSNGCLWHWNQWSIRQDWSKSLATLHCIRKNTKFRVLWVDALCINQGDRHKNVWQV